MGQETQRESLPETLQSVIDEIGRKSPAELAAAEREPDTAIIARKPEAWISALRPRVVDAEAFAIEQESWRTWNTMHLESEGEFNTPRVSRATS